MIKNHFSARFSKLPEQEKTIVEAGVDLYRHYRHETALDDATKNKYREYAKGERTLSEKQDLFTKKLVEVTNKYAGLSADHQFSESALRTNPNVKWATFALISEILDIVVPETVLDNFYRFAEVKNVGWGDNLVFNVPNSDLFAVSQASNGVRKAGRQRLHGTDVVLNPVNHIITVGEDLYRILAGKVNFGDFVTRVAQSVETQITVDVYNAIFNSYSNLGTAYKNTGAFAQATFNNLVQTVQAANRGLKAAAFGTKVALSKVLPDNQYFQFGLGEQYNQMGYLPNFQGTPLFMFDQAMVPNSDNLAVSDNSIIILSTGLEKIVKIGFEGETQIIESAPNVNASMAVDYTIQKRWDVKLVASQKYAMYNFS
jgi:hypothetical protein